MRTELSSEIVDAVVEESIQAHLKHVASGSIFSPAVSTELKLSALMEEVGEVARALIEGEDTEDLINELVQVANVALSWADCLSDQLEGNA